MDKQFSVAVLITCYNRVEKTINCLNRLFNQSGINNKFYCNVFLVDDGSTDGTSLSVARFFPSVNIIKGNGNLYWNRGMRLAWERALSFENTFDFYLLLNDDTMLFENALEKGLELSVNNSIMVGSTCSALPPYILTYGGFVNGVLKNPSNQLESIDVFCGNFVLVPNSVVSKIGILDFKFRHALGDIEYGLRAKKNNINLYLLPYFIGNCERNIEQPIWKNSNMSFKIRIKNLYSPLSFSDPREFFYIDLKYYGILHALFHFISIHFRVISPKYFLYVRHIWKALFK